MINPKPQKCVDYLKYLDKFWRVNNISTACAPHAFLLTTAERVAYLLAAHETGTIYTRASRSSTPTTQRHSGALPAADASWNPLPTGGVKL
jgi:hypothetical protein